MANAPFDPAKVTYLYFGTDWEAENRTSSHHVARWLAERSDVRYFECPGLRVPRSSGRDLRRIFAKVGGAFRQARRPNARTEVRTLLQLPFRSIPGVATFNRWFLLFVVRRIAARARRDGGSVVTWFVAPHVVALAGKVGEDLVVQYCVDDYASMPDVDTAAVTVMDETLGRRADLVFVASETLAERKRGHSERVVLSPHGVDVAHFGRAADQSQPIPADIAQFTGPVIGFYGLIEAWIDLDLVRGLAERHPDWNFVMIGRVAVTEVPQLPNIHFLGRRSYDVLPDYGRRFDVSIVPYRFTQQVHFANPIKLREYLAMEKPIVAVPTPEIDKFADVVRIATTLDEWDAAITAALAPGDRSASAAAMREAAAQMTWDARLLRVQGIVADALTGRPFDPPPVTR